MKCFGSVVEKLFSQSEGPLLLFVWFRRRKAVWLFRVLVATFLMAPGYLYAKGEVIEIDHDEIHAMLTKHKCPRVSAKEYTSITMGMIYIDCLTLVLERIGCMWNAPTELVYAQGYAYPVLRRTRGWLASERSQKISF